MRLHPLARRWIALLSVLAVAVPSAGLIALTTIKPAAASISTYSSATISGPRHIVAGPDGALWFANSANNSIGRITTSGTVTNFTDATIAGPEGITRGADGALWFTNITNNSIGRITTSGTVTNFTDATIAGPVGITHGPDGALWFTNPGSNSIGRITTVGLVTNFTDASISSPADITPGPDGALWFTNSLNDSIGRITTAGSVTNFTDATIDQPVDIVAASDGALWFTNFNNSSIGRITTGGSVTNFTDPSISAPNGIARGPDGALWFTNIGTPSSIGRITTSGSVTTFTDPSITLPVRIASGPDNAVWFTDVGLGIVGRLGLPKATDSCSATQTCIGAVGVVASASSPSESVVVTGMPDGAHGTVKLTFATGTMTCPTVPAGKRPVATLTDTGYSKNTKLRLTVTLRHTTGTGAAQVCLRKKTPFKSQSPATSKPGGGTGLLLTCTATNNVAPCVLSSKAVGTSIVVTFVVRGGDPDFSIQWPKGNRQSWLSQFGQGTVGKHYAAQLRVKGGVAPYRWKITSGKLPKGVALNASTGAIAGTPGAKGKFSIVVQATDAEKPAKKTKAETVPIVINAKSR